MIFNSELCTALANNDEESLIEQLQPIVKTFSYTDQSFQEDLAQELNIAILLSYRRSRKIIDQKYIDFLDQLTY